MRLPSTRTTSIGARPRCTHHRRPRPRARHRDRRCPAGRRGDAAVPRLPSQSTIALRCRGVAQRRRPARSRARACARRAGAAGTRSSASAAATAEQQRQRRPGRPRSGSTVPRRAGADQAQPKPPERGRQSPATPVIPKPGMTKTSSTSRTTPAADQQQLPPSRPAGPASGPRRTGRGSAIPTTPGHAEAGRPQLDDDAQHADGHQQRADDRMRQEAHQRLRPVRRRPADFGARSAPACSSTASSAVGAEVRDLHASAPPPSSASGACPCRSRRGSRRRRSTIASANSGGRLRPRPWRGTPSACRRPSSPRPAGPAPPGSPIWTGVAAPIVPPSAMTIFSAARADQGARRDRALVDEGDGAHPGLQQGVADERPPRPRARRRC